MLSGRLYHSGQFGIEEIAEKMDVLLEQAVKHIRYNTHFVGVNDLIPGSYNGDPFERLMPGNLSVSAEQVVYRKVCIELMLSRRRTGTSSENSTAYSDLKKLR